MSLQRGLQRRTCLLIPFEPHEFLQEGRPEGEWEPRGWHRASVAGLHSTDTHHMAHRFIRSCEHSIEKDTLLMQYASLAMQASTDNWLLPFSAGNVRAQPVSPDSPRYAKPCRA